MPPMSEKNEETQEIEREIRQGRQFTLADVIAREGGNFLKGESPIPKLEQLKNEINLFIAQNLADCQGSLQSVLQTWVKTEEAIISKHLTSPLTALEEMLTNWIDNEYLLYDLVMQVDRTWGEMNGEKPHFQQPGQPPHPEDEYTHDSVKAQLINLRQTIK